MQQYHGKLIFCIECGLPEVSSNASPGVKLRYYRELRDLSLDELGKMIGFTRFGIQNFEKGFNPIYYEDAVLLGNALDVNPEVFLDEYTSFCKPGYGQRIKQIREAYKQSQKEFAIMLGTDRSSLAVWECEFKHRHPKLEMYRKLRRLAGERHIVI